MHPSDTRGPIDRFTWELLRSGVTLADLAGDLIEALPADAHPGEDPAQVVLQMMSGTISSFLGEVEDAEVERATELIAGSLDRVIEHLKLALALRRRMEAGGEDGGRLYDSPGLGEPSPGAGPDRPDASPCAPVEPPAPDDPLAALARELLDCGGVLSQIIAGMVEYGGPPADQPGFASIPEVAHGLVHSVLADVLADRGEREICSAARIVREATDALASDIFFLDPDLN
jgi:hypothetical protein